MKTQSKKIPEGWEEVKLGDIAEVNTGKSNSQDAVIDGQYPLFDRSSTIKKSNKYLLDTQAIIVPGEGKDFIPRYYKGKFDLHQRVYAIYNFTKKTNILFVYHYILSNRNYFSKGSVGSTVPSLRLGNFTDFPILLPPLPEQKAIAGVLGSLDDKIELLRKQNETLEKIGQTLFHKWFVEDADPSWEKVSLGGFFPIVTGKKDVNYSEVNGMYPFFTCAQKISKAPDYSFDGKAVLLAGNGDFNVKRYEGKFEAYQRTYVLIPNEDKYFGFLYALIQFYLHKITGGAQGSVIKFITKPMIENFIFQLPKTNFDEKLDTFNKIYSKADSNNQQIQTLEKMRDTLLPKLVSGEVRVKGFTI